MIACRDWNKRPPGEHIAAIVDLNRFAERLHWNGARVRLFVVLRHQLRWARGAGQVRKDVFDRGAERRTWIRRLERNLPRLVN